MLILLRLWRYINHVLTYLLTYLLICHNDVLQNVGKGICFAGYLNEKDDGVIIF